MKSVLGAHFWSQDVETPRSLEAVAKNLPNEPPPLGTLQSTKISRSQQLLLLQRLLPVPCTPSYVDDEEGGLILDRVIGSCGGAAWWATLTARLRAQKLWTLAKATAQASAEGKGRRGARTGRHARPSNLAGLAATWQDWGHTVLDPSVYALGARARAALGPFTALSASAEVTSLADLAAAKGGGRQRGGAADLSQRLAFLRGRMTLGHKAGRHKVRLEGAWHERCLDRAGRYWEVPLMLAADVLTRAPLAGLVNYRLGLHHTAGRATVGGLDPTSDTPYLGDCFKTH